MTEDEKFAAKLLNQCTFLPLRALGGHLNKEKTMEFTRKFVLQLELQADTPEGVLFLLNHATEQMISGNVSGKCLADVGSYWYQLVQRLPPNNQNQAELLPPAAIEDFKNRPEWDDINNL